MFLLFFICSMFSYLNVISRSRIGEMTTTKTRFLIGANARETIVGFWRLCRNSVYPKFSKKKSHCSACLSYLLFKNHATLYVSRTILSVFKKNNSLNPINKKNGTITFLLLLHPLILLLNNRCSSYLP